MLREVKVFLMDAMTSNSMKSCNLDPGCSQGGCMVCIALEGNGARPSHMGKGFSEDGTMYTLNTIEQHSVCYGISRSMLKGGNKSNGGLPVEKDLQPTITANGCGAVAYAIENHPCDSRVTMTTDGIVQTLNARMGTGGGNVPLILQTMNKPLCYAVDSHPMDSRMSIQNDTFPTITTNIRKAGCDGPLVLMRMDK